MTDAANRLPILLPDLQISFYFRLQELRQRYLHEALMRAVHDVDIRQIDKELAAIVNPKVLTRVATFGLRGELFFPVPSLLIAEPTLLGYYRLLFGISQKEMYNRGRLGRFKVLEESGHIPKALEGEIPGLCRALTRTAELLVDGLDAISQQTIHELQLITLGPQLRGSRNTEIGSAATREFYAIIRQIVDPYVSELNEHAIAITNDSGRTVVIEFAGDPDVRITEIFESGNRPLVSIEIKGGTDRSNIHNRLGEAEKSHQKAKGRGFFEFWTILRVEIDYAYAKRETPTTSHFFHIDHIIDPKSSEYRKFRDLLSSLLGIQLNA